MIGIVIASHTDMAENILDTVEHIIGERPPKVVTFSTGLGVEKEEIKLGLSLAIGEVDSGDGVLVLTDISGGTPSVLLAEYPDEKKIEVITGVNLPMALEAVVSREGKTLKRLAKMAVKAGKVSIFSLKSPPMA
ncbi:MAG: PTS mannose transporter subunit IIC [Deltaproteobacteria bacterium]|nr:PTS mannose transporter subunit IIC [Candidatus Zymogenaceae bacterium]